MFRYNLASYRRATYPASRRMYALALAKEIFCFAYGLPVITAFAVYGVLALVGIAAFLCGVPALSYWALGAFGQGFLWLLVLAHDSPLLSLALDLYGLSAVVAFMRVTG